MTCKKSPNKPRNLNRQFGRRFFFGVFASSGIASKKMDGESELETVFIQLVLCCVAFQRLVKRRKFKNKRMLMIRRHAWLHRRSEILFTINQAFLDAKQVSINHILGGMGELAYFVFFYNIRLHNINLVMIWEDFTVIQFFIPPTALK